MSRCVSVVPKEKLTLIHTTDVTNPTIDVLLLPPESRFEETPPCKQHSTPRWQTAARVHSPHVCVHPCQWAAARRRTRRTEQSIRAPNNTVTRKRAPPTRAPSRPAGPGPGRPRGLPLRTSPDIQPYKRRPIQAAMQAALYNSMTRRRAPPRLAAASGRRQHPARRRPGAGPARHRPVPAR